MEDKNTIIYWYINDLDPMSTFGKEDGQEKKSNSYKKIRLHVVLGGGKWKNRKMRIRRRSEPVDEKKDKKRKKKNEGFGYGKLKKRGRKYRE